MTPTLALNARLGATLSLVIAVGACGKVGSEEPAVDSSTDAGDADLAGDVTLRDTTVDDASDTGGSHADAIADADAEVTPKADVGPPCAPIVFSAPFGVVVSGTVALDVVRPYDPSTTSTAAMLLFPRGRVVGAPVHLVTALHAGYSPRAGFAIGSSILDASLGATGLHAADPRCGDSIDAALIGPADGLDATVHVNFSSTDALDMHTGTAKLCVTSTLGLAPTFVAPGAIRPIDPARFTLDLPIDPTTLGGVRASAGGVALTTMARVVDGLLEVAAAEAFPSSVSAIDFDLSGVRDLLGRASPSSAAVSTVIPRGAVTDRSFATAPPFDAFTTVGSATPTVVAGALWAIGDRGLPYSIILALGSEPGAKSIRLRHRVECASGDRLPKVKLFSADGTARELAPSCSATFADETMPLTAQPSYLVVATENVLEPCSYPFGWSTGSYVLDDLAFVP